MHTGSFWTALVWAVIPFLALLFGVWWVDRFEKEPFRLLGLSLVFGGVVAPAVAYGLDKALDLTTSLSAQLTVPKSQLGVGTPLVEAIVVGATILAVLLLVRREIDDALDGLMYGAVIGIGFGAAANFVSIWSTPGIGHANGSLFASTVTALNQVAYGAVIGLALGLARRGGTPVLAGAAGVGAAAAFGLHVLHDYLPWLAASSPTDLQAGFGRELLRQIPNYFGVAALAVIALWCVGREKVIVAHQLRADLDSGVVTHDEYAAVTNSFVRWHTLSTDLLFHGERVWRARRALYHQLIQLAFRQYHRGHRESTKSRQFHDESVYRQRITELRARLHEVHADAARVRHTEKPAAPRHHVHAGLGGLTAFLGLVAVAVAAWYLVFQPSSHHTSPTIAAAAGASALAPQQFELAAATSAQASAEVFVCQQVSAGKCIGQTRDGGRAPRTSAQYEIVLKWAGLHPGDQISLSFVNLQTRQPVLDDVTATISSSGGQGFVDLFGPLPRLDLGVLMTYNGAQVKHVWLFHFV